MKIRIKIFLFISVLIGISGCEPKLYEPPEIEPSLLEINEFLLIHNKARKEVGVSDIVWDKELAEYAMEWAVYLASTSCEINHRPMIGQYKLIHGENLYSIWSSNPDKVYTLERAAEAWYDEKSLYDGKPLPEDLSAIGHYTQMIWKDSRKVGAAISRCQDGTFIMVANYDPPGNYIGQMPY